MLLGWEWGFASGLLGVCFWSGGVSGRLLDIHRLGGFGIWFVCVLCAAFLIV